MRSGIKKWSRRAFIGAGTVAGGGFLLGVAGFTFAPGRHSLVSADAAANGQLTTWITISPDNVITIRRIVLSLRARLKPNFSGVEAIQDQRLEIVHRCVRRSYASSQKVISRPRLE